MIDKLREYFAGKRILILGFGREGQSTYRLLRKLLPEQKLWIADRKELEIDDMLVECRSGEEYLEGLAEFDLIMKSPGISFANLDVEGFREKISSQMEVLLQFFEGRTIGVTGTKGKSTTSSLIYQTLKDQDVSSLLLGNIGLPVFDMIDEIDREMVLVLEMSSHQLEFMDVSPRIAVLLNIYPEHLDHYRSFDEYVQAKCNIFRFQNEEDVVLCGDEVREYIRGVKGETWGVGTRSDDTVRLDDGIVMILGREAYRADMPRKLIGDYNLRNIMFALGVAEILKLDMNKAAQSVSDFETLKHRLEYVGEYDGVKYYDNSIGTVPAATVAAVEALGDVDTLIIGGMDRGLDYEEFAEWLKDGEIRNVICMPETGWQIAKMLGEKARKVETLDDAVNLAKEITRRGKSCLLSPAAASYGFFKNFEEKGDKFQELVRG